LTCTDLFPPAAVGHPVRVPTDRCDLCGAPIADGEWAGFVLKDRMERDLAAGLVDRAPLGPARRDGRHTGWVVCRSCQAHLADRA
jgi:hypothetical protein